MKIGAAFLRPKNISDFEESYFYDSANIGSPGVFPTQ